MTVIVNLADEELAALGLQAGSSQSEMAEAIHKAIAKSKKREFFIETPLGKLRVYAKHKTDSPEDYPGVFVDYVGIPGEEIGLVCTEYVHEENMIQTCVYGDGFDEAPTHVEYHRGLEENLPPTKERVEELRNEYPVNSRVKLLYMEDPQAPPVGTEGSVIMVDDIGTIHVRWDNGSSLGVALGVDAYCKVEEDD